MRRSVTVMTAMCAVMLLVLTGAFFSVDETEQAVVTQFGEPVGRPIAQAGLYFKVPLFQKVHYFEKRILSLDGDANQIPTLDKRYIWVDTTARWRIIVPLKFMESVGTEEAALSRLAHIIDAAARDEISNMPLVEAVRHSNRLLDSPHPSESSVSTEAEVGMTDEALERIRMGREKLTERIRDEAARSVPAYGIELVDVRIKRINYVDEVQKKVYERMVAERKRVAEQYRSEGQGRKAQIEGQTAKELREIRSEAYRRAQEIKGRADAEAAQIFADAYNADPEFFAFTKTLETYRNVIESETTLILSTENPFFRYLHHLQPAPAEHSLPR